MNKNMYDIVARVDHLDLGKNILRQYTSTGEVMYYCVINRKAMEEAGYSSRSYFNNTNIKDMYIKAYLIIKTFSDLIRHTPYETRNIDLICTFKGNYTSMMYVVIPYITSLGFKVKYVNSGLGHRFPVFKVLW